MSYHFPLIALLSYHSLLFTRSPKWEELTRSEQALYHEDKEFYNKSARKGGKSLFFARSGRGETWVPLIEKAYAKLHGNYDYMNGGQECEAIEDLTGLVFRCRFECGTQIVIHRTAACPQ